MATKILENRNHQPLKSETIMTTENAIIKSVSLSMNDYSCLTLSMELEMGIGNVCFGSISMGYENPYDNVTKQNDRLQCSNFAAWYISKSLEVVGVSSINAMVGKPVRAIFKGNGSLGDVCIGIQHFLKDGFFFIPSFVYDDLNIEDLFSHSFDKSNIKALKENGCYDKFRWSQNLRKAKDDIK